jgi:HEAT repeat protein
MSDVCRRCGFPVGGQSRCTHCWEGSASVGVVREFVAAHEQAVPEMPGRQRRPVQLGRPLLSRIDDPEAAPALRDLLGHERAVVRGAAVRSLGYSGDPRDVERVAALLGDEHPEVRARARSALAELGGAGAADALFGAITGLDRTERSEIQAALAWLGDRRDLEATRDAARGWLAERQPPTASLGPHQGWGAIYALMRLGDRSDARMLVDTLIKRASSAKPPADRPELGPDLYDVQNVSR